MRAMLPLLFDCRAGARWHWPAVEMAFNTGSSLVWSAITRFGGQLFNLESRRKSWHD